MLLSIDIGNTSTCFAFCEQNDIKFLFKIKSDFSKSREFNFELFNSFLVENCIKNCEIDGIVMSSVVPQLTIIWNDILYEIFNKKCLIINSKIRTDISFKIDNPNELGSDLICDIAAGLNKYGSSTLIIDLGTATKYLIINKNCEFCGAIIAPGLKLSFDALTKGTALLSDIDFYNANNVIGKNTKECLNSGIVNGTIYQILGFARDIESELGYPLKKVITGGYSNLLIGKLKDFVIDDNLIFDGLRLLYLKNLK